MSSGDVVVLRRSARPDPLVALANARRNPSETTRRTIGSETAYSGDGADIDVVTARVGSSPASCRDTAVYRSRFLETLCSNLAVA